MRTYFAAVESQVAPQPAWTARVFHLHAHRAGAPAGAGAPGEPAAREPELDPVERASRESFPASDAPAWTGAAAGC